MKYRLRPIDQDEIGHRAFADLVEEEHFPAWLVIWQRASVEVKQHYFDRYIPRPEQEYIRALVERGPGEVTA